MQAALKHLKARRQIEQAVEFRAWSSRAHRLEVQMHVSRVQDGTGRPYLHPGMKTEWMYPYRVPRCSVCACGIKQIKKPEAERLLRHFSTWKIPHTCGPIDAPMHYAIIMYDPCSYYNSPQKKAGNPTQTWARHNLIRVALGG